MKLHRLALWVSFGLGIFVYFDVSIVAAQTLRIVTYNIDADTGGAIGQKGGPNAGPGLTTVLQAIGNATLAGHAQPIDVLALEELNTTPSAATGYPSVTLDFVVSQLNVIYGAGAYAAGTLDDPSTGGTGGGPSGIVYNTASVKLLSSTAILPVSGSGAARAPMRYKLAPVAVNDHTADFWMYGKSC